MPNNSPSWSERLQAHPETPNGIYKTLALGYLLPIGLLALYSTRIAPAGTSWSLFSAGLVIALFGAIPLLLYLRGLEAKIQSSTAAPALRLERDSAELDQAYEALEQERNRAQALNRDKLGLQDRCETLESQLNGLKTSKAQDQENWDRHVEDYKATIKEQRATLERKQEYILKLENKVRDLSYEMKTVLQVGDMEGGEGPAGDPSKRHPVLELFRDEDLSESQDPYTEALPESSEVQIQNPYDASQQLQKCLEVARKLTGADHLASNTSPRFLDFSNDSYAIDLRRLFDHYRNEQHCAIFLYAPKEEKLLFANNHIQSLLGWSPEKFVKDFSSLMVEGQSEWKHYTSSARPSGESQFRLLMKTRGGENLLVQVHLDTIRSGNFAGYIVGIVYAN